MASKAVIAAAALGALAAAMLGDSNNANASDAASIRRRRRQPQQPTQPARRQPAQQPPPDTTEGVIPTEPTGGGGGAGGPGGGGGAQQPPQPAGATPGQIAAARELDAYVRVPGNAHRIVGFDGHAVVNGSVREWQSRMGQIETDGRYGTETRERMRALGVSDPYIVPNTTVQSGGGGDDGEPPRYIVNEPGAEGGPAFNAAVRLYTSVANHENLPRNVIADLQRQIGVEGDGVIGSDTRRRVAGSLIARPNAAGNVQQRIAAVEYSMYRHQRGAAHDVVRSYQIGMGRVAADGEVGPDTDARARALLATA